MIIASCGHKLTIEEDQGIVLALKKYSREGNKCISYGTYCNSCATVLKLDSDYLPTEESETEWMLGDSDI